MTRERRNRRQAYRRHLVKKTMNYIKKIFSILTVVCCLVLSASFAAFATGEATTEETATTTTPRVTFTNEEKDSPALYITKEVTNASKDYPAPETDTFTFILRLNGAPAKGVAYRVLDASGKEVPNTSEGISVPFYTDPSGYFTLQAGQTAVFEEVGSGTAYEVEEKLSSDDYIQIQPAGGLTAVGTVGLKGTVIEFENLYNPTIIDPTVEYTTLVVQKSISFPKGYTPWNADEEFTFTARIGGKLLSSERYTVTNTADGSEVGTYITGSDGIFKLKGGQTATFEEVKADADYEIKEINIPEDWRCTGPDTYSAATKIPQTFISFNNTSASFAVNKSMDDSTHPNKAFEFTLTDASGNAWTGAKYYLYDADSGKLADESSYTTNKDGHFYLKPGQTAMFFGIPAGTSYNVKETPEEDYTQITPANADGYTKKQVSNSVEVLQFINRLEETGRILTVSKKVESVTTQNPSATDEFCFQILQKNESGDYEPVKGADYSIQDGATQYTYRTDKEDGKFYLRKDETAKFTALLPGEYQIKEMDWNEHYEPKEDEFVKRNSQTKKDEYVKNDTLTNDGVSFTFTNLYWQVPPTGIKALSTVWKVLIGVAGAALLAFAAMILVKRRKRRLANK